MDNLFHQTTPFEQHLFYFFFAILRRSDEFVKQLNILGDIKNQGLDHCITELLNGEFDKEQFLNNEDFVFLENLARKVIRRELHEKVFKYIF